MQQDDEEEEEVQNSEERGEESEDYVPEKKAIDFEKEDVGNIKDIKQYIEEQEEYLNKLESERRQIAEQMEKEELAFMSSLKDSHKFSSEDYSTSQKKYQAEVQSD